MMIETTYEIVQNGKSLIGNKIVINKYENKTTKLHFTLDKTIEESRVYFALLNPILNSYKLYPLSVNNEIVLLTEISRYPGIWRGILIATDEDYNIEEDLDQTKCTYVSNEAKFILVRDNFLSDETIEYDDNPAYQKTLDEMLSMRDLLEQWALSANEDYNKAFAEADRTTEKAATASIKASEAFEFANDAKVSKEKVVEIQDDVNNTFKETVEQAKTARAWAIGNEKFQETVDNNAKYYAEQAKNETSIINEYKETVVEKSNNVDTKLEEAKETLASITDVADEVMIYNDTLAENVEHTTRMHDNVAEMQAKISEDLNTSKSNVELAKGYMDSASNYNSAAKTSADKAEQSYQNSVAKYGEIEAETENQIGVLKESADAQIDRILQASDNILSGKPGDMSDYAKKSELPTKTSELTNDSGFLTEHQSLSNYVTKEGLSAELENIKGSSVSTDAIQYTEQNLTEEQKNQARKNLDLFFTGEVTDDVVEETTFEYDAGGYILNDNALIEGETYTVVLNDQEYTEVCKKIMPDEEDEDYVLYIGNPGANPFIIACYSYMDGMFFVSQNSDIYTLQVTGKYIKKNKISRNYIENEGNETKQLGEFSHAEGDHTTASGNNSHAEGYNTVASGLVSHAEGDSTTASSYSSHAEGSSTTASGNNSHAEGRDTVASGLLSHAEGCETTASGECSHTEGYDTTASGHFSHAECIGTTASGENSHAEGCHTAASGSCSHAEGSWTTVSGSCSHASGYFTEAAYDDQTVIGRYNNNLEDSLFEVGNGKDNGIDTSRSNAFRVTQNGTAECKTLALLDESGNSITLTSEQLSKLLALIS